MATVLKKIRIYFMSLGFLFILVFIKELYIPMYWGPDWKFVEVDELLSNNIISIVCVVMLLVVWGCKKNFDLEIRGCRDLPYKIIEIQNANENYIVFFTTYIIPLLDWDFTSIRSIILFVTVIILNGWLLIKTNLYYQNPMLALMGYNIYSADIQRLQIVRKQVILISKDKLNDDDTIFTHDLDEDVLLANTANT